MLEIIWKLKKPCLSLHSEKIDSTKLIVEISS